MYIEEIHHYPIIPDHVIEQEIKKNFNSMRVRWKPDTISKKDTLYTNNAEDDLVENQLVGRANFKAIAVKQSDYVIPWLQENIPGHQWNWQVIYDGTACLPHIDPNRTYAFLFIIEAGGPDVVTRVYKPKDGKDHKEYGAGGTYVPYEELDIIQEMKLEERKWYKLRVDIPHSVENLTKTRLTISHSFPDTEEELEKLWNYKPYIPSEGY